MTNLSDNTHVFLLRIWIEPRLVEGQPPLFRGLIEQIGSGEKVYIKDMDEAYAYFRRFFEKQGLRERPRSFWRRLKDWW